MLGNPIQESKNNKRKQIISFIIFVILLFGGLYYYDKWDRIKVWESEYSGVITSYDIDNGRRGYYYYTDKKDLVIASYFFNDYNTKLQLNIGDSIYKVPDSFQLYIYKKDNDDKYIFDRIAMKFKDLN